MPAPPTSAIAADQMPQAFVCAPQAGGKAFGAPFELGHLDAPSADQYLMPMQPAHAVTLARGQVQSHPQSNQQSNPQSHPQSNPQSHLQSHQQSHPQPHPLAHPHPHPLQVRAAVSLASLTPQPAPNHADLFGAPREPVSAAGAHPSHLLGAPPSAAMHLSAGSQQAYAIEEQQAAVAMGQPLQSLGAMQEPAYTPMLEFGEQPQAAYQTSVAFASSAPPPPQPNALHASAIGTVERHQRPAASEPTDMSRLLGHNSKEGATTSG